MDSGHIHRRRVYQRPTQQETNSVHELANVSTIGFKKAYQMALQTYRVDGLALKQGFWPPMSLTGLVNMTPGSRIATGNATDIYMNGQTVLGVQNERVKPRLRAAVIYVLTKRRARMVRATQSNDGGAPIVPPEGQFNISDEGVIYAIDPEQEVAEPQEIANASRCQRSAARKNETGLKWGQPAGDFERAQFGVDLERTVGRQLG